MKKLPLSQVKNVFITGGAGFIGGYMVKKFLASGAEVHVLDDLSTGSLNNLPQHEKLHFYQGSIMDKPLLDSFRNFDFDLVIHLASVVGMKLATKYQAKVYELATTGTSNVLEVTKNAPSVLFSSSAVYGLEKTSSVKEEDHISFDQLLKYDGGHHGYACGKWEMEQIGLKEAEKGRMVLIVRPFNVVGAGQIGTYGMVIPTFINQALNKKPLTVLDQGDQVRSFSLVNTFIECLFRLMEHEEIWTVNRNIVNIGTKVGTSINDLAKIVLEETQSDSGVQYSPYEHTFPNHKDVLYRVPDTSYGERYFGPVEWPSTRQIVKTIMDFNGNGNVSSNGHGNGQLN